MNKIVSNKRRRTSPVEMLLGEPSKKARNGVRNPKSLKRSRAHQDKDEENLGAPPTKRMAFERRPVEIDIDTLSLNDFIRLRPTDQGRAISEYVNTRDLPKGIYFFESLLLREQQTVLKSLPPIIRDQLREGLSSIQSFMFDRSKTPMTEFREMKEALVESEHDVPLIKWAFSKVSRIESSCREDDRNLDEIQRLQTLVSIPKRKSNPLPLKASKYAKQMDTFETALRLHISEIEGASDSVVQALVKLVSNHFLHPYNPIKPLLIVGSTTADIETIIHEGVAKPLAIPLSSITCAPTLEAGYFSGNSLSEMNEGPGMLLQLQIEAGRENGVVLIQDIDQLSDCASSVELINGLCRAIDPEQNTHFSDAYLPEAPINLNQTIFVLTTPRVDNLTDELLSLVNVIHLTDLPTKGNK
ncbi:MAG: hypothetical protein ACI9BD_000798 [Candidatus Marinamargulisbacteria bacterium]|jgi:hypothetical protein